MKTATSATGCYTSNARRDGLTPGQERAILAMLTERSIAAAARQANVGQSTLRRWLREDDSFQNKLRQLRDETLSHAALMLQQGLAQAVCIMHELIQSEGRIDPGRASLIRIAIEFAFRSAVYCDIIDRFKAVEKKAQRQTQPAGGNPGPAPASAEPQNGATASNRRSTPQPKKNTPQKPQPPEENFPRPARTCLDSTVEQRRNLPGSAQTSSLRSEVARVFLPAVPPFLATSSKGTSRLRVASWRTSRSSWGARCAGIRSSTK